MDIVTKGKEWGSFVKFSHTIFALPFAASMFCIVLQRYRATALQAALILVAVASARTAAMAYNRLVDRRIDAQNPRTQSRELPAGRISVNSAWLLVALSIAIFLSASALLGMHCLVLTPVVLVVLLGYSWLKRIGWGTHFVLGLGLALAPGGVWYALTAEWSWFPTPFMLGVLLWVAGFDVLYACQDLQFDRAHNLHSVPARVGIPRAFTISKALHAGAVLAFLLFGFWLHGGIGYFGGLAVFAVLVWSQHRLVSPEDLSRIDQAFFVRNGWASLLFFLGVLFDTVASRLS